MNIKENIINRLRETKRENIENVIAYMEENGFFDRGCHRHHRYNGGLADHAWQTYQLAMKEEADNKRLHPDVPLLDKDSLAISALLHDFCDCHGMHHIHNHGRRSAKMLKELGFHLTQEEFLAIRFHMSPSIAIFATSFTRPTANRQRCMPVLASFLLTGNRNVKYNLLYLHISSARPQVAFLAKNSFNSSKWSECET